MQCVQMDSHHVFVVGKTSVLLITFNITVAHCMQCVQMDSHHVFVVGKTSVLLITFQYYSCTLYAMCADGFSSRVCGG